MIWIDDVSEIKSSMEIEQGRIQTMYVLGTGTRRVKFVFKLN